MELTRDPDVSVYLVADTSLLGGHREFGNQAEVRRLRGWVADGLVEEVDDADERVLELARMTASPVVTGDRYVDHRVEHPWIQGNTWQFLKPTARPTGPSPSWRWTWVCARRRRSPADGTVRAEETGPPRPLADTADRGDHADLALPEPRCTLYDIRKGDRILLPRMRRGVPTCELHGTPLEDEGPRLGTTQLKAVIDGACVPGTPRRGLRSARRPAAGAGGHRPAQPAVPADRPAGQPHARGRLRPERHGPDP
ncbi:hypothetical protein GCM10023238_36570 [Streptomyces heliomycini]